MVCFILYDVCVLILSCYDVLFVLPGPLDLK